MSPRPTCSLAYASPPTLPPTSQGSLPAGRARPWPDGFRTRWTAYQVSRTTACVPSSQTSLAWSHQCQSARPVLLEDQRLQARSIRGRRPAHRQGSSAYADDAQWRALAARTAIGPPPGGSWGPSSPPLGVGGKRVRIGLPPDLGGRPPPCRSPGADGRSHRIRRGEPEGQLESPSGGPAPPGPLPRGRRGGPPKSPPGGGPVGCSSRSNTPGWVVGIRRRALPVGRAAAWQCTAATVGIA